jgi:anthranilate phosphoribosyltransferase
MTSEFERIGGWPAVLEMVASGRSMNRSQSATVMAEILHGLATPAQIAGLLVGLRTRGESVDEMAGFVDAMLSEAEPLKVPDRAVDIVGTGGSSHRRSHALNVSTMACLVAAGAGAVVCKHGNRKASSTSGSFDFLEALGVAIDLSPNQLEQCVSEVGVGFAFARTFHPAMRFAGPVRAELGIPTVFNVLGPLAHPGRLSRQVVGVSSVDRAKQMAEVLRERGTALSWVVAGADGLDELATAGVSVVFEVTPGGVETDVIQPARLGLDMVQLDELAGGSPVDNVRIFEDLLQGATGPYRDIVALNAAAGLVVAGVVDDLESGLASAFKALDEGAVADTLTQLRTVTRRLSTTAPR